MYDTYYFCPKKQRYTLHECNRGLADLTVAMSDATARRIVAAQQAVEAADREWRVRCDASDAWRTKINDRLAEIERLLIEHDWSKARQAWGLAMALAAIGEGTQEAAKDAERYDDHCAQLQIRLLAERQAFEELRRRDFMIHAAHSEIRKCEKALEEAVHPNPPPPLALDTRGRDGAISLDRWRSACRAEWKPLAEVVAHARKVLGGEKTEEMQP